jgi:hypothetical protein
LRTYCCAGASFLDLLLIVGRGRVLASHWMAVELLHIRIIARDRHPRDSTFADSESLRSGPPFRYLPTLCCTSFLRARPALSSGSALLRRSAPRRSPLFWSRSFFRGGSRCCSPSLTLRHCHLLQAPHTLPRRRQSARLATRKTHAANAISDLDSRRLTPEELGSFLLFESVRPGQFSSAGRVFARRRPLAVVSYLGHCAPKPLIDRTT